MGDKSMMQYLPDIKSKYDAISTSGAIINAKDVILHTLNRLTSCYHSFKMAI